MDSIMLILICVSAVIGFLIGLLINSFKGKQPKQFPPLPNPPKPGFQQAGSIWENERGKLFFEFDDALISAEDFSQKKETVQVESPPPLRPIAQQPQPPPTAQGTEIPARSLSIVEQVDDILQRNIANSPLSDKGISLRDDPHKGMVIWVGVKSYESITDIPDPSIQKIIKASVHEWETKTSLE